MHHLAIIIDNCVFRSRIINHSILTSNEHFLTDRMNCLCFIIILIFSNYLYINTRNRRKLNRTEDETTLGTCYESLSRLGEYHFRSMYISLITILILENTILQSFERNRLAHISLLIIIINGDNFDTSRRNIEGNFSSLNYENLTIYICRISLLNYLTFGVSDFTCALRRSLCFIYSRKKILVRTKRMTSNNLCHLSRKEGE